MDTISNDPASNDPARRRRFETVVLPHLPSAYNLARWLTKNDRDAEDIVQESCMRAFKFFDGLHGDNGRPWLLAIVRNASFKWLRDRREELGDSEFDEALHSAEDAAAATGAESLSNNPELLMEHRDARRQVNEALLRLPPEFREALVLRDVEDLSYKEIAIVAGIPIGTVMSRLARGRKLMAVSLQRTLRESHHGL
jgi:RNA polymerase sigma factor (sigma-70 family)